MVAAAIAFEIEMAYNFIAEWATPYKTDGSKNSYCLSISDELNRMAMPKRPPKKFRQKNAQRNAIASKMKQEEAEDMQLVRLASCPETRKKLPSQEPATSADARSAINSGPALSYNDACNLI
jgi:hypothetical protein